MKKEFQPTCSRASELSPPSAEHLLTETVRELASKSSDSLLAKAAMILCDALDATEASVVRMDERLKEVAK